MPKLGRKDDRMQFQGAMSDKYTTRQAPFGTVDTPQFRVKIIGGKQVTVLEPRNGSTSKPIQSSSVVAPYFTDSPSPKVPPQLDSISSKPNHYDPSKWSTPGVREQDTEIKPQSFKNPEPISSRNVFTPHSVIPPIVDLERYLPTDRNLPKESIKLTEVEELELRKRIRQDLVNRDSKTLKNIYMELVEIDRMLEGFVTFEDLSFCLLKSGLQVNATTLKLISSLFIRPHTENFVNYEKVLAFISASMKENMKPLQPEPDRDRVNPSVYTNPITHASEDFSPRSSRFPYGERDNAKLLRLIEQQILNSTEDINFESAWQAFRAADPQFRGKLSKQQIIEIAMRCRLPLQLSVIEQILNRVEKSYGQYDWQQFLEFIERVQPLKTSLHIPESKKPVEYVKHIPEPSRNWPESDIAIERKKPENFQNSNLQTQQFNFQEGNQSLNYKPESSYEKGDTLPANQNAETLADRFSHMNKALYDSDIDKTGYLTSDQARWIVEQYTQVFNLGIKETDQIEALRNSTAQNGQTDIARLIDSLGTVLFR
ncbi:DgyrCDS1114 [Dimorphilus gyrociliatus]|uniref:DgyrCDS1114 n=1 Tax=Dimorphilus gyrociliatus TaxID=2664684 RepID=A0A7I8V968_9ANNE|nr:DgyrCDS1114 [Dimorphilus gyrociliatus]